MKKRIYFSRLGLVALSGLCLTALGSRAYADEAKSAGSEKIPQTDEDIMNYWHSGKTLPLEVGKKYPPNLLKLKKDNGYNVLIDTAHQCSFNTMWVQHGVMQGMGYRTVSSQASLDTVLDPKGQCRLRIPFDSVNKIYPFAWYPNFSYNVVVTEQKTPDGQKYLPEEQDALVKFVDQGGALIISGNLVKDPDKMTSWSLNDLARKFGGELTTDVAKNDSGRHAVLKLGEGWEVFAQGDKGQPVGARRSFGKGKVVLMGSGSVFNNTYKVKKGREEKDADKKLAQAEGHKKALNEILDWCTEGQKPVGGEPRFPTPMGGGGAIYPELESGAGDIVVYYAKNQKDHLLQTVKDALPKATELVENWLPSRPTKEPMYLILSAGAGGGWAVNGFKPKENGIISDSGAGIISIYAHELAHTMSGPDGEGGKIAGRSPMPQRGEAHAGWFQGKVDAHFDESRRDKEARNCNSFFNSDKFMALDLKKFTTDPTFGASVDFKKGEDWAKNWYIFQKLDDRYGTSWYPRWCWVQHTRWQETPEKKLTWEETVEDMCIAVGEDLFPFFRSIGISLDREHVGDLEFQGEKMNFKVAPIEATPAGKICIEPVKDYKKPILVK